MEIQSFLFAKIEMFSDSLYFFVMPFLISLAISFYFEIKSLYDRKHN